MTRCRVHPGALRFSPDSSSSPSPCCSSPSASGSGSTRSREVLTVWMKSLVLHGNGCTVYDSTGGVAYRVDNYNRRCPGQVFLMDGGGRDVLTITRKKILGMMGTAWDVYRCDSFRTSRVPGQGRRATAKPWFRVRNTRSAGLLKKQECNSLCEVTSCGGAGSPGDVVPRPCRIERVGAKSTEYRLVDMEGSLLAEVKRKETAAGVFLGDDVFTLVVEANVDVSLVVGVVVVYGMVN